ncbi:Cof-type HAD-IIB family hydrolase [Oceanobacillus kimchii]|uniref:Cof-type HAD-IIB family hydrolase n=1 Tax=Oceanobacillus kimchii TaxID=746691 RepID=UPI000987A13C|nr:Cof-type HAD-IIB family hydrolase [Oceanobacillus kimchii]
MKLIAIDLDGTLLSDEGNINQVSSEAIRNRLEAGDIVAICSGRSLHDTKELTKQAGLDLPLITGNGAVTYADHKVIEHLSMRPSLVHELMEKADKEGLYFEIYTNEGIYLERDITAILEKEVDDYPNISEEERNKMRAMIATQKDQFGLQTVEDYHSINYESLGVYKVFILSFQLDLLANLNKELQNREDISITGAGRQKLEISNQDASKGNALLSLAEYFQVPMENTVAIGDNFNDIPMFEVAGKSIAMGNAEPEVKEKSDITTKNYKEDGVAYALNHLIK